MDVDGSRMSLIGRQLPPPFERRVLVLAPAQTWVYDSAQWRDAIVVVEQGQIELEGLDGSAYGFAGGAVLWLDRLPLRALHNRGSTPAVLVAVTRRAAER